MIWSARKTRRRKNDWAWFCRRGNGGSLGVEGWAARQYLDDTQVSIDGNDDFLKDCAINCALALNDGDMEYHARVFLSAQAEFERFFSKGDFFAAIKRKMAENKRMIGEANNGL